MEEDEFLCEFLYNRHSFIFLRVHPSYIKFFSTDSTVHVVPNIRQSSFYSDIGLASTVYPCLQSDNPPSTCEGRFFIDGSIFIYCSLQTVPIRGSECRR